MRLGGTSWFNTKRDHSSFLRCWVSILARTEEREFNSLLCQFLVCLSARGCSVAHSMTLASKRNCKNWAIGFAVANSSVCVAVLWCGGPQRLVQDCCLAPGGLGATRLLLPKVHLRPRSVPSLLHLCRQATGGTWFEFHIQWMSIY